jgi:hypothetical protein
MPYTFRATDVPMPQFVCCGINPGMVEVVARALVRRHHEGAAGIEIGFYELDTFRAEASDGRTGVTWSPETLVEEVMDTPSIEVRGGILVEHDEAPTRSIEMVWGGRRVPARLVGHEEVWHATWLDPPVRECRFAYGLAPGVMRILAGEDSVRARQSLTVPRRPVSATGSDSLVVAVRDVDDGQAVAREWRVEHAASLAAFGVNATQLQTARSVLFFTEVLADHPDAEVRVPFCASTMPREWFGAGTLVRLRDEFGIGWNRTDDIPEVRLGSTVRVTAAEAAG